MVSLGYIVNFKASLNYVSHVSEKEREGERGSSVGYNLSVT